MVVAGLSSCAIPLATALDQLIVPHFGLGLGVGAVDAALVPMLANLVDATRPHTLVCNNRMNTSNAKCSTHIRYVQTDTLVGDFHNDLLHLTYVSVSPCLHQKKVHKSIKTL